MKKPMKAIELTGTVDQEGKLHVEETLDAFDPGNVRVIILVPDDSDFDEEDWLRSAARNSAFDFLDDPDEGIYSLADGKPFHYS